MICGNQQNCKKQMDFMMTIMHRSRSLYDCIDEEGKALAKRVAPISLSYKQLFFCNYVGNLTGIYDVNYFGKITISSIRKTRLDALAYDP
jgi:hypothetical protein